MRTLYLMRHAKATDGGVPDKRRPLAPQGITTAQQVGSELQGAGIQHVLCSTSERTRQTLTHLGLRTPDGAHPVTEYMDALYLGPASVIRQRIGEIDDEVTVLLVVAHSPGIPRLASELAWQTSTTIADRIACWYPTASVSRFTIEGNWADLADGTAQVYLDDVARPTSQW